MNQEIVREFLIKHSRSDKNGFFPETVTIEAKLTNPVCGDHVELKLHTDGSLIREIGHKAQACAICSASASILCDEVRGKDISVVLTLAEAFERGVTESKDLPWPQELGALNCFEHLRVNPSRRMCGVLPWIVLRSAIRKGAS